MKFNKIIFLDIDNVLNPLFLDTGRDEYGSLFYENFVNNLKILIEKTGAKIVISSTWRQSGLKIMQEMWVKRGLPGEVVDCTPDCAQLVDKGDFEYYDQVERGHEIQEWLDNNEVQKYVIIDDVNEFLDYQQQYFVKTYDKSDKESINGFGFTNNCLKKSLEILE